MVPVIITLLIPMFALATASLASARDLQAYQTKQSKFLFDFIIVRYRALFETEAS